MSPPTRQLVFHGTHPTTLLLVHLTVLAVGLLLVVALSRYERRLLSRPLGMCLLSLRLAVFVVIFLTLLQPTISWTLEKTETNRILVGIDLSESMTTIDLHATQGEKLRVARGLEMVGNSRNEARIERWQAAFDSGQQPDWVDEEETDDEERRAALAKSRRDHLRGIFAEIDKLSRIEIARRLLVSTRKPVLDELEKLGHVELFAFAGNAESLERRLLDKDLELPFAQLEPQATDLSVGMQRSAQGQGTVSGVILLTDGRDHAQRNLTSVASSLKSAGTPVYPVLLGSSYRPRDVAIIFLEHPQVVYKGDHPRLRVTVSTTGFEGKLIELELVSEDDPDAVPIKQTVTGNSGPVIAEFDLDAEQLGRHGYVVRTPVLDDEMRDDNNSRSFKLNVVDDRAKVLIIEGEPRWEFRYLSTALGRDERVDLRQILFSQPYLGVLPEPFFPSQLILPDDPQNLEASSFADCDLVIVGDVSPEQFSEAAWNLLLKFAVEGGTVILSAGQRNMPLSHRSTALEQLLPILHPAAISLADATQEASPRNRGLPLQLTADGEQQPMLQFAPDLGDNIGIWKGLPGQMWAVLGEARPGATVWATTQVPAGRIDGLNTDRKFGIMIHQFVGAGQVVWLGIDGTWRWRYRVGDQYHHRFWGQLARWAATNKMSSGTDFVRFGTEKANVEMGQPAVVRALWTRAFLLKHPQLQARAEFFRPEDPDDKPTSVVELKPASKQPLQHEGQIASLAAGEYRVKLAADGGILGQKPIQTTIFVDQKESLEMIDVSSNQILLAQIAEASGGRLFLPDEVHKLPSMFRKAEETTSQYEEITLWDRWPWLIIVFSLLTTEWVIRKINGLP
ncbi:hypothetical protein [Schlesneria sp. DSM 10557]|uniref:hypothetical protein n=1 Tax=Schlesneria sp. DSM 10557 TaxID=3044399 RepID=UPI0035A09EDE